MKVPYMDLTGQVKFGDEKQVTPTEFDGYFNERESDVSGTGSNISDNHDSRADLEAEQTADMRELRQREQVLSLIHI